MNHLQRAGESLPRDHKNAFKSVIHQENVMPLKVKHQNSISVPWLMEHICDTVYITSIHHFFRLLWPSMSQCYTFV